MLCKNFRNLRVCIVFRYPDTILPAWLEPEGGDEAERWRLQEVTAIIGNKMAPFPKANSVAVPTRASKQSQEQVIEQIIQANVNNVPAQVLEWVNELNNSLDSHRRSVTVRQWITPCQRPQSGHCMVSEGEPIN